MKQSLDKLLALVLIVTVWLGIRIASAHPGKTSDSLRQGALKLVGEVERKDDKLLLSVTNTDQTRVFKGSAQVSFTEASPAIEAVKLTLTLGPQESRSFPLMLIGSSGMPGTQYALTIYDQAGMLTFYKIAPIKQVSDNAPSRAVNAASTTPVKIDELKIQARLTRGLAGRESEILTPEQVDPFTLTFEIQTPRAINDGNFELSGKNFKQRRPVSAQTRASVEFKLPVELSERKLSYTLTDASGRLLAQGEANLDQLLASDAMSVREMTFDRSSYAPGEAARMTVEIQGDSPRGYRLEITAKDSRGATLFQDHRKGASNNGSTRQEFMIELPAEMAGQLIIEYKVFGGQTGALFDSGSRQIVLKSAGENKTSGGGRLSP